ncbi:MAG TPA: hypothetical protein VI756_32275 [Blastocatellia bacterium]
MKHRALPDFWFHYRQLPLEVQELADKNFELLKTNPRHPSLHFKKIGDLWSARVGLRYRALALDDPPESIVWFWIGRHDQYESLIDDQ